MVDALELPARGLLAIVGAGGKTTAMYRMALELTMRGHRVICTTTTKILPPDADQMSLVLAENNPNFLRLCVIAMGKGKTVCAAWTEENGKLQGLTPQFLHRVYDTSLCDWLLVEADGARCLPLKAPADHEPVIPERSTHVLAIAGLSGIGTPLDEKHVCRSARFAALTGTAPGASVTPESVARLCAHPNGMFKDVPDGATRLLWLNQADTPGALDHAHEILSYLSTSGHLPHRACVGSAGQTPCLAVAWT